MAEGSLKGFYNTVMPPAGAGIGEITQGGLEAPGEKPIMRSYWKKGVLRQQNLIQGRPVPKRRGSIVPGHTTTGLRKDRLYNVTPDMGDEAETTVGSSLPPNSGVLSGMPMMHGKKGLSQQNLKAGAPVPKSGTRTEGSRMDKLQNATSLIMGDDAQTGLVFSNAGVGIAGTPMMHEHSRKRDVGGLLEQNLSQGTRQDLNLAGSPNAPPMP